MPRRSLRKELVDLVNDLSGWRLEPRTTPGASPLWCFMSGGKVELALSVEGSVFVLYVMDTDAEMRFSSREALVAWLGEHRPDAVQPNPSRGEKKERARKFFEWG